MTVEMDRVEYDRSMSELLSDCDTYSVVNRDPTNMMISELHGMLTRWKRRSYINELTYKRLNSINGILSRAYGLPKIHKPNNPFRIIISSNDSQLYNLAYFLQNIIRQSIPPAKSKIENSTDLLQKLITSSN